MRRHAAPHDGSDTGPVTVWMSSGAFDPGTIDAVLSDAERFGIRNIELSSGLSGGDDPIGTITAARRRGFEFLIHNYFPAPKTPLVLNIASPDPKNLSASLAFAKRAITISQAACAPFYSVHAGFALALTAGVLGRPNAQREATVPCVVDRAAALARMKASLHDLLDFAEPRGVRLLIENNVVASRQLEEDADNPLLLCDPHECATFLEGLGRPGVGLLLDVGHAKVAGSALGFDPAFFFERCAHWIGCVHLSDNDGTRDQNAPITTSSWFMPYLEALRDRPMVVEAYGLDAMAMTRQIACVERAAGICAPN